jgi:cytochrome P450
MLGSFLRHGLSQEQLESETLTQITAGSDSSATAIRMTIYYICSDSAVHTRLMAELSAAVSEGKLTRPVLRDAESRQLPYLQACIKEGLRLCPPVNGLLAKAVPPGGDIIDGIFVEEGIEIGWNSYSLTRDPAIFGADAAVFRPERWLPSKNEQAHQNGFDEQRIQKMDDVVGLVFGYGRFGCLGKPVAILELNKAIAELLLRFSLRPVDPTAGLSCFNVGFYLHDGLHFRVTRREDDAV